LFLFPVNDTRRTADDQREVFTAAVFFRKKLRFIEYPMNWRIEKRNELFFHKTLVKPDMDGNDRRRDESIGKENSGTAWYTSSPKTLGKSKYGTAETTAQGETLSPELKTMRLTVLPSTTTPSTAVSIRTSLFRLLK